MKKELKEKTDSFIENYSLLRKAYKWRANDMNLRFGACLYTLNNKSFAKDSCDDIIQYMKKNTGLFSNYRSVLKLQQLLPVHLLPLLQGQLHHPEDKSCCITPAVMIFLININQEALDLMRYQAW